MLQWSVFLQSAAILFGNYHFLIPDKNTKTHYNWCILSF